MSARQLFLDTIYRYKWEVYRSCDNKQDCVCLFSRELLVRLDILYIAWIYGMEYPDEPKDQSISASSVCSWCSVS